MNIYPASNDYDNGVYTDWDGIFAAFNAWAAEHPDYRTWDTSTEDTIVWAEYSPEFGVSVGAIDYDRDQAGGWSLYSVPFDVPEAECSECGEVSADLYKGMCESCVHNARRSGWEG